MSKNSLTESYIKLAELKIPHVDLSAAYAALNIQDIYTEAYRKLLEGYQTSITQLQKQVADSFAMSLANFSSVISESTRHAMEVSNKAILQKIMHSDSFCKAYEDYCTPNSEDDDYVTIEESVAKEYNFPETVVVPVGKKRVRISSALLVTILGSIILPILLQCSNVLLGLHQSYIDAQTEEKRIQIEEERNDLLKEHNQLLDLYINTLQSIDTSHSSQAETIESLKENLPKEDLSQ